MLKTITRPNKWAEWYDDLPQNTKDYLDSRPLWYDHHLYKAFGFGLVLGFLLSCILR
jgi:hypothetical protein